MRLKLRKYHPFILITFLLLACQQTDKPIVGTFHHDGIQREYIYYQSSELTQNSPLVVVLHGFTSSAEKIMNYTKFNELARLNDFAVLYPQGTLDNDSNTFWNVGYDFHQNIRTDDVDFIILLTEYIKKKYQLSSHNTFLTGMSNGGEMCYKVACEQPDAFKAIAPVAGMMLHSFYENAQNSPVPVFATFGTADDVTRYEGDSINADGWGDYQSIESSIAYWALTNSCNEAVVDTLPDKLHQDSSFVIKNHFLSTNSKNDVQYYKIINGGHDWPGAWGNKDINISNEIWKFFETQIDSK
ncbi:extracellular catalytic domain type 1 short-chain-length polyhydroxyalkanoate depolymerase [Carboxylicivirga marina]|uniref:Prolyl oligopeptidase family serine peptidase n=1 Tax=Carboxylicivirga marina TaxID=2800988 RepID=A0ABS1HGR3_9BACT|nr:PHB depolymerase family esterase [Carboxylicivirga marina]MBK3516864.1 prolyl oligopeptidase family serine peptidase [Carboxylicivirga marina]